jgi:uncharacterized membrane protein YeaQ/YmgE (transglycosylase-associated protein family)
VYEDAQTAQRNRASIPARVPRLSRGTTENNSSLLGEYLMNFIIWLIVGGLIGWVASIMMRTNGQQGMVLNVVVGIVGAMLGGWFISPMVGVGTINQNNFSLPSVLVSLVGAVILLAIVNLVRRGTAR